VERQDSWRPGTPTPVAPLHLRLFHHDHHVQNGYAYANPPRSPVYAVRPILVQFEDPQAWDTTCKNGARPAAADSAHSTAARPRTSHPRKRVRPIAAAAAGYGYGYDRRADARNIWYHPSFPSSFPHCLCSANTDSAVARAVHGPRIRTVQLCLCKPYTPQLFAGPYA